MNAVTICSMLHEDAAESATRLFRRRPVISWTVERLRLAKNVRDITVLCWDDQLAAIRNAVAAQDVTIVSRGPRNPSASMRAVTAARRWADGWRGGLLQTCDFDTGFDAAAILNAMDETSSEAAVLVDPSAALVDPVLIDAVINHAVEKSDQELCFMPAAPGLSGVLLRRSLLEKFAVTRTLPGKWLHYLPDHPSRDPIAGDGCVPVATAVARTTSNFRFDSQRQIDRMTGAFDSLNGQLIGTDAETLVSILSKVETIDRLPREIVLELNTNRRSRAIFRPTEQSRSAMTIGRAQQLFDEFAALPDLRLTIAGCGDPLESDVLFDVLAMAEKSGTRAVHVETDLLTSDESIIARLASAPVDVVTVHLPAATVDTYATVMGVDSMTPALKNLATLVSARAARGGQLPLFVPTFTKCRANLGEMELWYDQWIRALGCAVIGGPSDFGGQIVDVSVADMSPPLRRPCRRMRSRLTVLSDGRVVACEQDFAGRMPLGRVGEQSITEIWTRLMRPLRDSHASGDWNKVQPLCGTCREWNRP